MAKVAVMTDSGADLSPEEVERYSIRWLPVQLITPEGKVIRDDVSLDIEAIYEDLASRGPVYSTAQLTADEIAAAADKLLGKFDYVVYIVMSSKMSSTYNNALAAQRMVGSRLVVFDSRSISGGQGALVHRFAADLSEGKVDAHRIEDYLQWLRSRLKFFFVLETLDFLAAGGRIGRAAYLAGRLLKICPALTIDDEGVIVPHKKLRGKAKILPYFRGLLEEMPPDGFPVRVVYGIPTKWDEMFLEWISKSGFDYVVARNRPTINIHGGPWTLGVSWFCGGDAV